MTHTKQSPEYPGRFTASYCDFNWSMQHLISNYREKDVEIEAAAKELLHRN